MAELKKLNNKEMEKVNGGMRFENTLCPNCNSDNYSCDYYLYGVDKCECKECGTTWNLDLNGVIFDVVVPTKYDDPVQAAKNILKLKEQVIKHFKK